MFASSDRRVKFNRMNPNLTCLLTGLGGLEYRLVGELSIKSTSSRQIRLIWPVSSIDDGNEPPYMTANRKRNAN